MSRQPEAVVELWKRTSPLNFIADMQATQRVPETTKPALYEEIEAVARRVLIVPVLAAVPHLPATAPSSRLSRPRAPNLVP
jgi:hypothetical protein